MGMNKNLTWYDGPDGEYAAKRDDGWIVAADDHSTWVIEGVNFTDDFIPVKFEEIDPGYSHRIQRRFDLIDRLEELG